MSPFLFFCYGLWFWVLVFGYGFLGGADRVSGGLLVDLRFYDTGGGLDAAIPRGDGVY